MGVRPGFPALTPTPNLIPRESSCFSLGDDDPNVGFGADWVCKTDNSVNETAG